MGGTAWTEKTRGEPVGGPSFVIWLSIRGHQESPNKTNAADG